MNGLRLAIKNNLPESWEKVLRKHKMLQKFVEYAYLSLPDYMKGSKKQYATVRNWKLGLNRILHLYKNAPIYNCFQGQYLNIDNVDWMQLWEEIKQYEENCR